MTQSAPRGTTDTYRVCAPRPVGGDFNPLLLVSLDHLLALLVLDLNTRRTLVQTKGKEFYSLGFMTKVRSNLCIF